MSPKPLVLLVYKKVGRDLVLIDRDVYRTPQAQRHLRRLSDTAGPFWYVKMLPHHNDGDWPKEMKIFPIDDK